MTSSCRHPGNTHADLDARRHEGHKAGFIPAAGRAGLLQDVRSAVITSIISPAFLGLTAPALVSSMKCLTQTVADAVSGTILGATPPSVTTPWNLNWDSECSRSISMPWNRGNTASRALLPPPRLCPLCQQNRGEFLSNSLDL